MSTKVSQFMGGLGIDARDKFEDASNATVMQVVQVLVT